MYRVNFPSRLTEEEKLLKKKYKLLREKREQLEKRNAEEDDIFVRKKKAVVVNDSSDDERKVANKRAMDPKEVAKKLVQSGAIVLRKNEPVRTFKRTQALERKLSVAPRPPPPLKMKLKRVYDEGPKKSMELEDMDEGTTEMKSASSRYVCHLPSLPGSRPSSVGMGARTSAPQPSSSSASANQPSSSSSLYMKAGPSSAHTATEWHKLVEANRRRMNETRRDFVDYKRRGLVSYRDVNESSDDDD